MKGKFIVIEGTDGSGKGTQYKLLLDKLKAKGYDVASFDFPRYGQPSAYFVEQYLQGKYGTADEVGPFRGAMFYALDRYAASFDIRKSLSEGMIVLSNRYIGSNMAHQGGKLRDPQKRRSYYEWCQKMELLGMRIPKPDLNLVLHVSAEKAFGMVNVRALNSPNEVSKRDVVHESDLSHLKNAEEAYTELCEYYPEQFVKVECMDDGRMLNIDEVATLVWRHVQRLLAPKA